MKAAHEAYSVSVADPHPWNWALLDEMWVLIDCDDIDKRTPCDILPWFPRNDGPAKCCRGCSALNNVWRATLLCTGLACDYSSYCTFDSH